MLTNDGKLRYYNNSQKQDEKGVLDLRFFGLSELADDAEVQSEEDGETKALKIEGSLFKIMKGKQFMLKSGENEFYMASPDRELW